MKLLRYFIPIVVVSLFFSCDPPQDDDAHEPAQEEIVDNTISTDFNSNTFTEGVEAELLKELKICNPNATSDTNERDASCSPKFFRFFKLTAKDPLKDGFILLIKSGVNG